MSNALGVSSAHHCSITVTLIALNLGICNCSIAVASEHYHNDISHGFIFDEIIDFLVLRSVSHIYALYHDTASHYSKTYNKIKSI